MPFGLRQSLNSVMPFDRCFLSSNERLFPDVLVFRRPSDLAQKVVRSLNPLLSFLTDRMKVRSVLCFGGFRLKAALPVPIPCAGFAPGTWKGAPKTMRPFDFL